MPWKTATGTTLEYPLALHAKLLSADKRSRQDVDELMHAALQIHHEAQRMSNRIVELEQENLRLKHENEFMIRLVSQREA